MLIIRFFGYIEKMKEMLTSLLTAIKEHDGKASFRRMCGFVALICLVIPHLVNIYRDVPLLSQPFVLGDLINQSEMTIEQLELVIRSQQMSLDAQRNFIDLQKYFAGIFAGIISVAMGFGTVDKFALKKQNNGDNDG